MTWRPKHENLGEINRKQKNDFFFYTIIMLRGGYSKLSLVNDYMFIFPGTDWQKIYATIRILHGCEMRIQGSAGGSLFWHCEGISHRLH